MNTTELNIEFSKLIELKNKVDKLKQLQKEAVQRYLKKNKDKILQKRKEKYELLPDDKKEIIKAKRNQHNKNKYYTDEEYRTKTLTKRKELYKKNSW